ncbi:MAG: hypothetical protein ACREUG_19205 [Steroidobacteraceae bacterium]
MEIGAEISLYPLAEDFGPRIKAFLDRLRAAGPFRVVTTSLSTQIIGEYDAVLEALVREMRATLAEDAEGAGAAKAVFIVKVFGPLAAP